MFTLFGMLEHKPHRTSRHREVYIQRRVCFSAARTFNDVLTSKNLVFQIEGCEYEDEFIRARRAAIYAWFYHLQLRRNQKSAKVEDPSLQRSCLGRGQAATDEVVAESLISSVPLRARQLGLPTIQPLGKTRSHVSWR